MSKTLMKSYEEGKELMKKELEENVNKYLIKTHSGLIINWKKLLGEKKLMEDPNTFEDNLLTIEDYNQVKNTLLTKVLGSELTAQNASDSWVITNGEEIFSPRNSDGQFYSFMNRERAIFYAKLIGLSQNQVYGNYIFD